MKKINQQKSRSRRFRRFLNRPYAVFCSLKKEVTIGVLGVTMLTFANAGTLTAQAQNRQQERTYELEEVKVNGSRLPLEVSTAARMVTVLDREDIASTPAQTINDILKFVAGVDVRQRGGLGVQTDISIRGGTFDQITILLNGINICDPQTGHNVADFPVDIDQIERIEVLQGPAGRAYGASSLVGAINIVTRDDSGNNATVKVSGGSFGYLDAGAKVNLATGKFNNQVSGSYTRSDGHSRNKAGSLNAGMEGGKLFYQGSYTDTTFSLNWHFGFTNKDYGANTFYSTASDDQFEHVRKFYTAVQGETHGKHLTVKPAVYWNRGEDRFEFYKGKPDKSPYNYHRSDVYGVSLNNFLETKIGITAFGAEIRNEGIISTNLGEPLSKPRPVHGQDGQYKAGLNRTNISFHLEHNITLRRFSVSAGVFAIKNTGNEMNFRFYPGVDASFRFARDWKVYASYNTSLRMPTFTELYYSVGGHQADKNLKPEEMQSFELGFKYLNPMVRATASIYYNNGRNMIDWIKDISSGEDADWMSVNHTRINTLGVAASALLDMNAIIGRSCCFKSINLSYSYISQDKETTPHIQSKYALEYLKHKVVAQANFLFIKRLGLNVSYRWQDRIGNYQSGKDMVSYRPYSLLDARLSWNGCRYRIYAEVNNILNKTYYDHGNIPQPGIWARGGVSYTFGW